MQCEQNIWQDTVATQVTIADHSNSKPYKESRKKGHHKIHKHKRKVKLDRFENKETLTITQEVKGKKHKYKCIINLTKTCEYKKKDPKLKKTKVKIPPLNLKKIVQDHKEKETRTKILSFSAETIVQDPKPKETKTKILPLSKEVIDLKTKKTNVEIPTLSGEPVQDSKPKETKVKNPTLSGKPLQNLKPKKTKAKNPTLSGKPLQNLKPKETKEKIPPLSGERIVPQCFRQCYKDRTVKSKIRESSRYIKEKKSNSDTKCELGSLSPISLSSIDKYCDRYYENISSDSFTMSSEDDIDTLIKRTKDRERRQSKSFESQLSWKTSTPKSHESISDAETKILPKSSEINSSPHSIATLLLEPQVEFYSPSRPTSSLEIENKHFINVSEANQNYYINRSQEDSKVIENKYHNEHAEERLYSPALICHDKNYGCIGNVIIDACHCTFKNTLHSLTVQHSNNIKHEPYSPSDTPMCCDEQTAYEVDVKFENPEFLE